MEDVNLGQENRHVLVTGGAGYIGSVLVPMLLNRGFSVTVIDNFMYGQTSLLDCIYDERLTVIYDDIRNIETLKKHIAKADIIIPLAAIVGAPACDRIPHTAYEINQLQAQHIVDLVSKEQLIIFPVTNSGYGIGQGDTECDENSPLNPLSVYGKTKVDAEKIILDGANAVTFRLATVFGSAPRMRIDLLVNDFVYRAFNDRFVVLFESHFKRNYIHIRDVSLAFIHGINNYNTMSGEAYNVGLSSANFSKMELCLRIKQYVPDFQIIENEFAEDPDKRDYIVSNRKIENTGWAPEYSLDYGIKELLRTYSFLRMNNFNNK